MLNEMFVKHSILRDPNMKMCTLVVYPGPLSFSRVMPVWTWKLDTIDCALCHHNSSHRLNEMFVKLSILQDPNMKMCTLVAYPGPLNCSMLKGWVGPSSFPRIMSLKVVFQICFGSIRMMGTREDFLSTLLVLFKTNTFSCVCI